MIVAEAIERAIDEFLYVGGEGRPPYDILDADITIGAPTLITRSRQVWSNDDIAEIDAELIHINDADVDTPEAGKTTLTSQERGYLESAAAAHIAGARVYLNPDYSKVMLLNITKRVLGLLFPWGAYRRVIYTSATYDGIVPIDLPAEAEWVVSVRRANSDATDYLRLRKGKDWEEWGDFSPMKVRLYQGGFAGAALQIVYATDYDLTNFSLATNLNTIGVVARIQEALPLAIAGQALRGKELPRVQIENILAKLQAEGNQVPVGAATQVGETLMQIFRREYVNAEVSRLDLKDPPRYEFVGER